MNLLETKYGDKAWGGTKLIVCTAVADACESQSIQALLQKYAGVDLTANPMPVADRRALSLTICSGVINIWEKECKEVEKQIAAAGKGGKSGVMTKSDKRATNLGIDIYSEHAPLLLALEICVLFAADDPVAKSAVILLWKKLLQSRSRSRAAYYRMADQVFSDYRDKVDAEAFNRAIAQEPGEKQPNQVTANYLKTLRMVEQHSRTVLNLIKNYPCNRCQVLRILGLSPNLDEQIIPYEVSEVRKGASCKAEWLWNWSASMGEFSGNPQGKSLGDSCDKAIARGPFHTKSKKAYWNIKTLKERLDFLAEHNMPDDFIEYRDFSAEDNRESIDRLIEIGQETVPDNPDTTEMLPPPDNQVEAEYDLEIEESGDEAGSEQGMSGQDEETANNEAAKPAISRAVDDLLPAWHIRADPALAGTYPLGGHPESDPRHPAVQQLHQRLAQYPDLFRLALLLHGLARGIPAFWFDKDITEEQAAPLVNQLSLPKLAQSLKWAPEVLMEKVREAVDRLFEYKIPSTDALVVAELLRRLIKPLRGQCDTPATLDAILRTYPENIQLAILIKAFRDLEDLDDLSDKLDRRQRALLAMGIPHDHLAGAMGLTLEEFNQKVDEAMNSLVKALIAK